MVWAAVAQAVAGRAAAGISARLGLVYGQALLNALFLLFLVVVGFRLLNFVSVRGANRGEILSLPRRPTASREWATGAAVGWGLCLAAVLPVLLSGHLHARLNQGAGVAPGIAVAVFTLLILTLADEVIFRGYAFERLAKGLTPSIAAVVMSLIFASVLVSLKPPASLGFAITDGTLLGLLLSLAYLRTHALWAGWGLHFAYRLVMGVVLGLPFAGRTDLASLMDAGVRPPRWLSGGTFGLDAAVFTGFVLLGGMAVLYRLTREWAWAYTTPEIVPAGYAVEVAPPAAHAAMEKAATPPPPLVQILPTTSSSFSAGDRKS